MVQGKLIVMLKSFDFSQAVKEAVVEEEVYRDMEVLEALERALLCNLITQQETSLLIMCLLVQL
jgi:hypothetical protein